MSQQRMTSEQAINLLNQAVMQIKATREEHMVLSIALETLKEAASPKTPTAPESEVKN